MVEIWRIDRDEDEPVKIPHPGPVTSVAWGPDNLLAVGYGGVNRRAHKIAVWKIEDTHELVYEIIHDYKINSMAWSRDGKLAFASEEPVVRIWDVHNPHASSKPVAFHRANVSMVVWSSHGRLATSCAEGMIGIWHPASRSKLPLFAVNTTKANSLAFSPDGRRLVARMADRALVVLNTSNARWVDTHTTDKDILGLHWSSGDPKIWAAIINRPANRIDIQQF
jgi:WD40 repeat protein